MGNEKNFLLAIIVTVLVLTFYPAIMKHFFPQMFPAKEEAAEQPAQRSYQEKAPPTAGEGSQQFSTTTSDGISQQFSAVTYRTDKTYVLENQYYLITLNAPGADIKSIVLKQFISPATQQPTVLMDTDNQWEGIFALSGLLEKAQLDDVITKDDEITLHYSLPTGLKIIKQILLDYNSYSVQLNIKFKNSSSEDKSISYRTIAATGLDAVSGIENRFREVLVVKSDDQIWKKNIGSIKSEKKI